MSPPPVDFFEASLGTSDSAVSSVLRKEFVRQEEGVELIASENIVSRAVLEAASCVLTNKYAEGYIGRRYYGGCEPSDDIERLAIERVTRLFNCPFANVQPHSGAQANQAVFFALLRPGDTYLSLALDEGGHLSHGAPVNISGKWFNPIHYGLDKTSQRIDYDALASLAAEHKPQLILAGGSAYPRIIDFARIGGIAKDCGAYFMVDMAHIAGLVAGKVHPSPLEHADVVTSTTHKTLRSARGGLILSKDEGIGKKINSSVFPGLQGGPLMHLIAAKAVGFGEALRPEFADYARAIIDNAQCLAQTLLSGGYRLVSGGTDTHLVLVDLSAKQINGKDSEESLERAAITCNKNSIPQDLQPPQTTSGIRLGVPAVTTRGMGLAEIGFIGEQIVKVLDGLASHGSAGNGDIEKEVRAGIIKLCKRFPLYRHL